MGFNSSGRKNAISALISIALHLCAFLLLCISVNFRTKPNVLHVMKVSVVKPEPPKPPKVEKNEPPKPKPEPPKPEPPKPEPPKPEPPKPEPPKPEPPKPVPPKPEPPKVVKPLPEPPKPKPEPPKPKPEPPKPKPEPPKTQPKQLSLEERIRNAETVKNKPAPKTIDTNKLNEKLKNVLKQDSPSTVTSQKNTEIASVGIVPETSNYAEQVVKPYIHRNWIQPVRGELDVPNPTPVEISFIVYASGIVSDVRVVRRSNSRVMNSSVEDFISGLKQLSPLSSIGSKAQSLKISVSMVLTN